MGAPLSVQGARQVGVSGVKTDVALEMATYLKTRRGVIIKTICFPQCASPSAETLLYPSPSSPAAIGVPASSLPAVSFVGFDSQFGSTKPESARSTTMEKHEFENARDL